MIYQFDGTIQRYLNPHGVRICVGNGMGDPIILAGLRWDI